MVVAKRKVASGEAKPSRPEDHATVRYKTWVRAWLDKNDWGYDRLWREMRDRFPRTAPKTSEAVHLFLGKKDREPVASNTRFMTELNKTIGIAPPPRCDPTSEISELQARIADRWWKLTPRERAAILAFVSDDEESSTDPQ